MNRTLELTQDGSHTLFSHDLDEPYHSIHGALQESQYVYINQGFNHIKKSPLRILEIGFGTGLNLLLTLRECEKLGISAHYHAVDKYPLVPSESENLNYEVTVPGISSGALQKIHSAPWEMEFDLTHNFRIYKEQADFRTMKPKGEFDLVFFDAFSPDKQPELWSTDVFSIIASVTNSGSILVTYSSKGSVRKSLTTCGFKVTKVPGPPGKFEMVRAVRI